MKLRHFKFISSIAVCVCLLAMLLVGCGKKRETLAPFGWTTTGRPSDTLLIQADRALMSYADPHALDSLVQQFCKISETEDPGKVYEHRRLYWMGNARFMQGDYETGDSLRRLALAVCDSIEFARDYRLYRMVIEQPSDFPDNASRYRRYKDDLGQFLKAGDMVSGFTRAVQLSGLMAEAGMAEEALEYALLSDSLLAQAGLPTLRTNNRVNLASAYAAMGDTVRAEHELRVVRDSVLSYSIPSISAIVDYNLFILTGDVSSLYKAWTTVNRYEALAKMRPLVASSIISSGNVKLAAPMELSESLALSSLYDFSPGEQLEISGAMLLEAEATCDVGRMKTAGDVYMKAVNNYIESQHRGEVIAAQTSQEIRAAEERERLLMDTFRIRVRRGIFIGFIILSLCGIGVYHYVERQKRTALLNQLDSERLQREVMAKELMLVEKQKLNENLQREINNLVSAHKVEKKTAEEISNIIESTKVAAPYEHDDAEFLRGFIAKYPNVSKAGRKLALLIRKGLETADIAREINIRKESVMQGRWRLRNQMGLSSDSELDVELRKS